MNNKKRIAREPVKATCARCGREVRMGYDAMYYGGQCFCDTCAGVRRAPGGDIVSAEIYRGAKC